MFDDLLGDNEETVDTILTRGLPKDLDVYHLSQCYLGLPKPTTRKNSNKVISLKETSKVVGNIYRNTAGFYKF